MPTPNNYSFSQPWALPGYTGRVYADHNKAGFKTVPPESRSQVLFYSMRRCLGELVQYVGPPSSASIVYTNPWWGAWNEAAFNGGLISANNCVIARNKAYARFREKAVGENSALGAFSAERREAFGLVRNRVLDLYQAYRSLRRGDFKQFLRKLLIQKPKRKHRKFLRLPLNRRKRRSLVRKISRQASSLWLEYWFGWSPMVQDLYSIVDTISQDPPHKKYSGSATTTVMVNDLSGSLTQPNYTRREYKLKYTARTGGIVTLTNPNLFLLNQLGLANPLSVAWEVVPFSFVVDWFTKFGDVIQSYSDWLGLDLMNTFTSYYTRGVGPQTYTREVYNYPTYIKGVTLYAPQYCMTRKAGLIKPVALVPVIGNFGHSKTRAATAVSLLVQLFIQK